jgi:hypothetical protein
MKKTESMLKEYTQKLSDENLSFINLRLSQRLCGDISEVFCLVSKDSHIDKVMSSARSHDELMDFVEAMTEFVDREAKHRLAIRKSSKRRYHN